MRVFQSFEEFMAAQVAAIMASGLSDEEWIERHAEAFRANSVIEEACEA